jgi:hypothetical protein
MTDLQEEVERMFRQFSGIPVLQKTFIFDGSKAGPCDCTEYTYVCCSPKPDPLTEMLDELRSQEQS